VLTHFFFGEESVADVAAFPRPLMLDSTPTARPFAHLSVFWPAADRKLDFGLV